MGIPSLDSCNPGVEAVGFSCIVAIEQAEEKTAGGIIIPDSVKAKEEITAVRGRLVSVGSVAFDFAHFPEGTMPKPGDAVVISHLAGRKFQGKDEKHYRLCQDRDVVGMIVGEDA